MLPTLTDENVDELIINLPRNCKKITVISKPFLITTNHFLSIQITENRVSDFYLRNKRSCLFSKLSKKPPIM